MSPPLPPAHPELAARAEELGQDAKVMESYNYFQTGTWNWFFSYNEALAGAVRKPQLMNYKDFLRLRSRQASAAKVIVLLAGLDETRIHEGSWSKLSQALQMHWPDNMYAVFQSPESGKGAFLCNVFVGECIDLADKTLMSRGKYYAAKSFYTEKVPSTVVVPKDKVSVGDIVTWRFDVDVHHLEIVTRVIKRSMAADGFCSRGAGRGDGEQGEEKCDGYNPLSDTREVDNDSLKFLRLK